MSFLYDLVLLIYAAVTLPVLMAKGKLKDGLRERKGFLPPGAESRLGARGAIWVHAVSVGEVRLAFPLIRGLLKADAECPVVLTTTTASSQKIAREADSGAAIVTYGPFDLSWMVRRFMDAARPRAIVILETEVWPNLLREAERRGIPVLVVNARLSDRAFPAYRRWRIFLAPVFGRITRCLAQGEEHAGRYREIGVPADRIRVTGNMKFDLETPAVSEPILRAATVFRAGSKSVLLAASTHPGEEAMILSAFLNIRKHVSEAKLIIAPRHLERLAEVEEIIRVKGLKCAKISDLERSYAKDVDVLLVDVWGVLNQLYTLADLVFVGGSLVPVGGHNLAEPAAAGRPVLYGPWTQNFRDMEEEFRGGGAGVRVADARELERRVIELFQNPEAREMQSSRSKAVVAANTGATARNLEEILKWSSKN
ncbi:MAG: 3-deoxy-D-manno-octulosonic acid transferase [Candidatus Omnitrophica bacterium]|jgi:3-deoxy-D-manno-octulosonic-acid transferase|nr:3-deoxy-D-manno-octulosonic acid transferase [Candidatus Omnitrophota bacterium]